MTSFSCQIRKRTNIWNNLRKKIAIAGVVILGIVSIGILTHDNITNRAQAIGGAVTVNNLSLTSGTTSGGDTITIYGSNFLADPSTSAIAAVQFGDTPALDFTVINDSTITTITPPHIVGETDLNLITATRETVSLPDAFTYIMADVSNVSPGRGLSNGGNTINITGKNFKVSFIQIATGSKHSLAIDSMGNLYAWGSDDEGQIGDGSSNNTDVLYPKKINGYGDIALDTRIVGVAAGYSHSLAIDSDGNLYTWGSDDYGQMGNGGGTSSGPDVIEPWKVNGSGDMPQTARIIRIIGGLRHTLAVDSNGNLYAWGYNRYGQIGNNASSVTEFATSPVLINGYGDILSSTDIVSAAAGHRHSMALDSNGNLYTWGTDSHGQIGNGTVTGSVLTPWKVNGSGDIASSTRIVDLAGGYIHSSAIDSNGNLYTWGGNHYGQIGNGSISSTEYVTIPWKVNGSGDIASSARIISAACGSNHTLAFDSLGNIYSWGRNTDGQIGNGDASENHIPYPWKVNGNGELALNAVITDVAGGSGHTMVIDSDGNLYTWGRDEKGQIGNGNSVGTNITSPWKFGKTVFDAITEVSFGGIRATSFIINSDTSITTITPGQAPGKVDVNLTTTSSQVASFDTSEGGYVFYATPEAPKLSVEPRNQSIKLSWTIPNENFSPITNYVLQRSTLADFSNPNDIVEVYNGHNTSVTDTGLVNGVAYYYRVRAMNEAGFGAFSFANATLSIGIPGTGVRHDSNEPLLLKVLKNILKLITSIWI